MKSETLEQFGKRLAAVRLSYGAVCGKKNLSRTDFAEALGMESAVYRQYERGDAEPKIALLVAVRALTGISLDYLIADQDIGLPNPHDFGGECTATFGERVRWARELYESDISAVAEAMGVSAQTYRHWETGRQPMPDDKQIDFARRFNVSMPYLRQGLPVGLQPAVLGLLQKAHPGLWRPEASPEASPEPSPEASEPSPPQAAPEPASPKRASPKRASPQRASPQRTPEPPPPETPPVADSRTHSDDDTRAPAKVRRKTAAKPTVAEWAAQRRLDRARASSPD
jgi:transcriptional regulator with XRE-family HTH domain